MAIRKYGAAYQGSKSKIADEIISMLPARKYFIDAFSGGGNKNKKKKCGKVISRKINK